MIKALIHDIDYWYIAQIEHERAADLDTISEAIKNISPVSLVKSCKNITEAYQFASKEVSSNDRIIVFGSFFTVADIMKLIPKL